MSPRLLSLFPEKKSRFGRHRLFSPTMFSFQKDGYFSLPELFDVSLFSPFSIAFLCNLFADYNLRCKISSAFFGRHNGRQRCWRSTSGEFSIRFFT